MAPFHSSQRFLSVPKISPPLSVSEHSVDYSELQFERNVCHYINLILKETEVISILGIPPLKLSN